jgi:hypothetical protein
MSDKAIPPTTYSQIKAEEEQVERYLGFYQTKLNISYTTLYGIIEYYIILNSQ